MHTIQRAAAMTAAALLGLSGCVQVLARLSAEINDVPATWSAADAVPARGEKSLAAWWLRFNDPLLARLIADALHASTTVNSAQASLRQARAVRSNCASQPGGNHG